MEREGVGSASASAEDVRLVVGMNQSLGNVEKDVDSLPGSLVEAAGREGARGAGADGWRRLDMWFYSCTINCLSGFDVQHASLYAPGRRSHR